MPDYYQRTGARHVDGTRVFQTDADRASEQEVARILETAWQCELHSFGALAAIDWWASKAGRLSGLLELKTRSHESQRYPTVFLNVRKWLALTLASVGLGVPSFFVVRFKDVLLYTDVGGVGGAVSIGGTRGMVKSVNDVEPVIEVPVADMVEVKRP